MLKPAIFLDRDGVIIENRPGYVRSVSDSSFIPNALSGIKLLCEKKVYIFIITNQAAIGRGIMALKEVQIINGHLKFRSNALGAHIDDIFMCPHHPEDGCYCRKPKPGLFLQAFSTYKDIDRERCFMVGDMRSDMQAAEAVGITPILVKTGLGEEQMVKYDLDKGLLIKDDLLEAAEFIKKWLDANRTLTRAVAAK